MTRRARSDAIRRRFDIPKTKIDSGTLCAICVDVSGVTGAGIMLMSGNVQRGSLCTTDSVSSLIEELQFSLGEGPCLDAFRLGVPVLEPDLINPSQERWSAFSGYAIAAGVRALFGFPVHVGPVKFGALNLYSDTPGGLSNEQHTDCLVLADAVARSVVAFQTRAPPGEIAAEFEAGGEFETIIHQASGMVAAQLDVTVDEALISLRSLAVANGETLRSAAESVVAGERRLPEGEDADTREPGDQ